jgi:ParB family chromosome partitioning protein
MSELAKTPEARREVIRRGLEDLVPVIAAAYAARDWEHFGFESWGAYLADFGQLRLGRPERAEVVGQLRAEGLSQPAIAGALGVSVGTVHGDLQEPFNSEKLPKRIVGLDGKNRPASVPHVLHNSGENEWYTPQRIIEAARAVLGGIDLDPASSLEANTVVGASRFYTREDDGLAQDWKGRVWLNPPYVSNLVERFSDKLRVEYVADRVEAACLLVNNATETGWWQRTIQVANAACFPKGRISYWHPGRVSKTPLQGQSILYFGPDTKAFNREFSQMGTVLEHR